MNLAIIALLIKYEGVDMMSKRAYNFNAGPAALPLEVLQQAQQELIDYRGIGMSIMEVSHRSKEYDHIHQETMQLVSELLNVPDGYKVLLMQGGASTQFALIPFNFGDGGTANYIQTGSWANKAIKEAEKAGIAHIAASSKASGYAKIPDFSDVQLSENAAYLHITSNETIGGLEYKSFPDTGRVPLIADMSSDIMSRPLDVSQFSMIYAGAQKNLGPSGVTLVILKEELASRIPDSLPAMLRYDTFIKSDSLYNTPPVYSIYMMNLVLQWVKKQGGLQKMEKLNKEKTDLIYNVIDQSDFYRGVVEPEFRSAMNIPFRIQEESLEKVFIEESGAAGFVGLKGHRSVGGLRASTYNSVPRDSCKALADFMVEFQRKHG